ncbi:hypothetical protein PHYPO_G00134910 [Pangasianodon hypophthalmus]|uniref:Uncharacterized protein n=1 Tax=Pangasianodon hypophthalmus TaxID=310915 RepID=A0A5N5KKT5_PANHP|nr:hypothetical protein PHYPO_G00134910 [Pangasianodon hypophthalmus]
MEPCSFPLCSFAWLEEEKQKEQEKEAHSPARTAAKLARGRRTARAAWLTRCGRLRVRTKVTRRRGSSAVMIINSAEGLTHGTAAAARWAP